MAGATDAGFAAAVSCTCEIIVTYGGRDGDAEQPDIC